MQTTDVAKFRPLWPGMPTLLRRRHGARHSHRLRAALLFGKRLQPALSRILPPPSTATSLLFATDGSTSAFRKIQGGGKVACRRIRRRFSVSRRRDKVRGIALWPKYAKINRKKHFWFHMALKIVPIFIAQRFYFHFWTAEIAAFWPLKAEVNALSAVAWFTFQTFALPTKARLHSQRRGNNEVRRPSFRTGDGGELLWH